MRLFQHDEFASIVTAAAAARSLDEAFVEKDYYITETLRIIAGRYQPGQVIFKGRGPGRGKSPRTSIPFR